MDDSKIIGLYWARNEQAISETDRKYRQYCRSIALNILKDRLDADECVSDTWLHAWNAMPPQKPNILSAFLARITRNLSFDRFKAAHTQKRGGGSLPAVLEELHECIPSPSSVEQSLDEKELIRTIDAFLRTLPERECNIFLRRYWYADNVRTIAERMKLPENSVKSILFRTREKLRAVLQKEGIAV